MALKKTTSKATISFEYLDKILTYWHERNLKTPVEINSYLVQNKSKNQNIKKLEKQTGYTNYEQRERSNWDNFYANTSTNTSQLDNITNIQDNKINL